MRVWGVHLSDINIFGRGMRRPSELPDDTSHSSLSHDPTCVWVGLEELCGAPFIPGASTVFFALDIPGPGREISLGRGRHAAFYLRCSHHNQASESLSWHPYLAAGPPDGGTCAPSPVPVAV
jgi:hypothetical protein